MFRTGRNAIAFLHVDDARGDLYLRPVPHPENPRAPCRDNARVDLGCSFFVRPSTRPSSVCRRRPDRQQHDANGGCTRGGRGPGDDGDSAAGPHACPTDDDRKTRRSKRIPTGRIRTTTTRETHARGVRSLCFRRRPRPDETPDVISSTTRPRGFFPYSYAFSPDVNENICFTRKKAHARSSR